MFKLGLTIGLIIVVGSLVIAQSPHSGGPAKPDEKELATKINNSANELLTTSRQLTFEGPRAGEGYFSADGKKMIFQSEREPGNPFYQMYVMDLTNGQTNRVSPGKGMTTCGWIHPNMKTVMWSSTHLDKTLSTKVKKEYEERSSPVKKRYSWSFDDTYSIFTSDLEGRNLKQLTYGKGYNAEGSYSPDGKLIAFASNRAGYPSSGILSNDDQKRLQQDPSYFMDIYIMDADGKNVRQLTNVPGYDGGPFFSADGKKLTWRRFSENGLTAEIYTMNIDGTEPKKITSLGAMSWAPYFHPSGDYIIFGTSILGMANFELFIVDSVGQQKPVRVTFAEGFDGLASFSPDGNNLTWSHRNDRGESQIYLGAWNDALARKLLNLPDKKPSVQMSETLSGLTPEITKADSEKIVRYLASDYFQGRPTGSEREIEYVEKLKALLDSWGLSTQVQRFEFTSGVKTGADNKAEFKGRFNANLKQGEDYQLYSSSKTGAFMPAPIAFAGFGIVAAASSEQPAFDSYKDLDVKGKWVMFFSDSPKPAAREFKKHTHLMAYARMQHKISVAKNKGASGIIIVEDGNIGALRFEGALTENHLPILKISFKTFSQLVESHPDLKMSGKDLKAKFDTFDAVPGFSFPSQYLSATIGLEIVKSTGLNLIGRLDPAAPFKNNPALLIGAHGDHLGQGQQGSSMATSDQKNKIHYGADDNASGVSGVMELAHYFSAPDVRSKLRKPLIFAIWSGEEIGILGSNHYIKTFKDPLARRFEKSIEAGLNMDMIGRLQGNLQIQGVGSAKEWNRIVEKLAATTPLNLVLTADPYLPTDAMAIYVGKVPSISFFTGAHLEYHTPNDTADRINYEGLVRVIDVVRKTAEALSSTPQKVVKFVQVEGNQSETTGGGNRGFKIFLGTIPDYSQEGIKGLRITGTAKNSPAEVAGLKAGDVIVEFDKVQIENIYDYVYALQTVKPDTKTQIKVRREAQVVELEITPKLKE